MLSSSSTNAAYSGPSFFSIGAFSETAHRNPWNLPSRWLAPSGYELGHFAIDSSLGLVAADYFEHLLRVRLGHLRRGRPLSLRIDWCGGDHQNGNNQPQVQLRDLR